GGDTVYVRHMVKHLPRVAPDVDWVFFTHPAARALLPAEPPNAKYVECPIPSSSIAARVLWEQLLLPLWIGKQAPDLLHAPVNVAPLACPIPTVLTLHEAEPFMPPAEAAMPAALRVWWRFVRKRSAQRARRIITVSQAAKDQLIRYMGLPPAK